MATTWSERAARGGVTKANHVTELRNAIDANIGVADPPIPAWSWSWFNLDDARAPRPAPIQARYFTEMRAAIQRLWDNKLRGPLPGWSSGVTPGGLSNNRVQTVIRATDVTDLRRWLNQYEDNHPRYGVDSKSYDPSANNRPLIQDTAPDDWAQDLTDLAPRPLVARCELVARPIVIDGEERGRGPLSNDDLNWYRDAFATYRSKLHVPVVLLTLRTFAPVGWDDPQADVYLKKELDGTFSNAFIDQFSSDARRVVQYLVGGPLTARHVIIWNEPNGDQGANISAEHFAALLYHCRQKLNQVSPRPAMYWGGVLFAGELGLPYTVDTVPSQFVQSVYQVLEGAGKAGAQGPWPWDGINVHVHQTRQPAYVDALFDFVRGEMRAKRQDNGLLIVGEWGITVEAYNGGARIQTMYNLLKPHVDQMIYFSHHVHEEDELNAQGQKIGTVKWGAREYYEAPAPDSSAAGAFLIEDGSANPPATTPLWQDLKDAYANP